MERHNAVLYDAAGRFTRYFVMDGRMPHISRIGSLYSIVGPYDETIVELRDIVAERALYHEVSSDRQREAPTVFNVTVNGRAR